MRSSADADGALRKHALQHYFEISRYTLSGGKDPVSTPDEGQDFTEICSISGETWSL